MLELTTDQVFALCEIEAKGFVDRVRQDLAREDPRLTCDASLASRLWVAFQAARRFGIEENANLVAFLRADAYDPHFYEQMPTRAWLTRPGRSADERFRDFLRVTRWHLEHPNSLETTIDGRSSGNPLGESGRDPGARIGARWRQCISRWRSRCRNGESTG
ncbi:hypothetical protein [Achromobacter aloeverae]